MNLTALYVAKNMNIVIYTQYNHITTKLKLIPKILVFFFSFLLHLPM